MISIDMLADKYAKKHCRTKKTAQVACDTVRADIDYKTNREGRKY